MHLNATSNIGTLYMWIRYSFGADIYKYISNIVQIYSQGITDGIKTRKNGYNKLKTSLILLD